MINKAIKIFRQYNKMTQSEVADCLSISKSYVSEIESGKKTINMELLEKFAGLYDMPVSSLVFFSESLSKPEHQIPKKFRNFVSDKVLKVLEWKIERENEAKAKAKA